MKLDRLVWRLLQMSLIMLISACGGGTDVGDDASLPTSAQMPAKTRSSETRTPASAAVAPFAGNGWYWNPAEGGTGFMFEAQGSRAFVGSFMYEEGTGKPVWYAATGNLANGNAARNHRFTGDLRVYHAGMGLTDRTRTAPTSRSLGSVSIEFVGGRAIVSFPGGRVMTAEPFCAGGPCVTNPAPDSPLAAETGWYWHPDEGGRGYAIEPTTAAGSWGSSITTRMAARSGTSARFARAARRFSSFTPEVSR